MGNLFFLIFFAISVNAKPKPLGEVDGPQVFMIVPHAWPEELEEDFEIRSIPQIRAEIQSDIFDAMPADAPPAF